jgi:hypothetical protein
MPVLHERTDDAGDDELTPAEWHRVRKAMKGYKEGKYLTEEDVIAK